LTRQLCQRLNGIPNAVKELHNKCAKNKRAATLEDHLDALLAVANKFGRVYIIIDALDECSDFDDNSDARNHKFLSAIESIRKFGNFLITSRPYENIKEILKGVPQVQIRADVEDVKKYLDSEMNENPYFGKFLEQEPSLRNDILSKASSPEENQGM